jgi:polyphosphate kinase
VLSFQPQTAKELLEAFNNEVKFRITTHHFRTEVQDNRLIGYICTNTKADKGAIATILGDSKQLKLISIEPVTSKELEKHYTRGQPSLKNNNAKK